jgi:S1-C subfamily serine protease
LDILLSLNGKAVTSPRQAIDEVRRARSGSIIRLKVQRGRGRLFLAATKP